MFSRIPLAGVLMLALSASALRAEDKPKPKLVDYQAELNDKLGKGIVPEKNACVLLWKAFGREKKPPRLPTEYFKRLGIEPPKPGDYFVTMREFDAKRALDKNGGGVTSSPLHQTSARPWKAKDYPETALWLQLNEKPLAIVIEASRRPDYFNPLVPTSTDKDPGLLIGALLPAAARSRDAADALSCRAMLRVGEGQFDEAWTDLIACHRLGRLASRGGTTLEALIGYAIDRIASTAALAYLANAKLTPEQIRARLEELRRLPPLGKVADKLDLAERYTMLDAFNFLRRTGYQGLKELAGEENGGKPSPEEIKAFKALDWSPSIKKVNRWYDRIVAAARIPDRVNRLREFEQIEADLKKLRVSTTDNTGLAFRILLGADVGQQIAGRTGDIMIALLMPAFEKAHDYNDRAEQIQVNLHVAFALAAYRADSGRFPAKLDDLAPKYLKQVPGDLFSGKPLTYKPTAKGYLLYSVGIDGKDDGGREDDLTVEMPLPPSKKP